MRHGEALQLDPHLPEQWKRVRLPLRFRGAFLRFDFRRRKDADEVGITVEKAPVTLLLDGQEREFRTGSHSLRRLRGQAWEVGPT
jgi:cellobiose phosphorylase